MPIEFTKTEQNAIAFDAFVEKLMAEAFEPDWRGGDRLERAREAWREGGFEFVQQFAARGWKLFRKSSEASWIAVGSIHFTDAPELWRACEAIQERLELSRLIESPAPARRRSASL